MSEHPISVDAFERYYNEVWLDQLIEEAFRLAREKGKNRAGKED